MSIHCSDRVLEEDESYFSCSGLAYPRGGGEPIPCPITLCYKCGSKHAEGDHNCPICKTGWSAPTYHDRGRKTGHRGRRLE